MITDRVGPKSKISYNSQANPSQKMQMVRGRAKPSRGRKKFRICFGTKVNAAKSAAAGTEDAAAEAIAAIIKFLVAATPSDSALKA